MARQEYVVDIQVKIEILAVYPPTNKVSEAAQIQNWKNKYSYKLRKAALQIRDRISNEINQGGDY